ncbi:hypothetical protein AAF712_010626 [Marasmius tenuissimus]|uniref:Uncharacterized protein n=1 Tax=Marasmius tenuissimus TaxID=585030 RepID=A0ABR2ZP30_9AGAR
MKVDRYLHNALRLSILEAIGGGGLNQHVFIGNLLLKPACKQCGCIFSSSYLTTFVRHLTRMENSTYSLEEIVLDNIKRWELQQQEFEARQKSPEIFGVDWLSFLPENAGESPEADIDIIVRLAEAKGVPKNQRGLIWTWVQLPFALRQTGLALLASEKGASADLGHGTTGTITELVSDVDEWITNNEAFLRARSRGAQVSATWTFGLVELTQLPTVLSEPYELSPAHLKIYRPTSSPGFCILGERREKIIFVQPSQVAFNSSWELISGNVLKGLDWSNIFVAGGSVLGALITPECSEEGAHSKQAWSNSDIDLYIWGVSAQEALKRIEHVAQVYQSNIPPDAPFLAVRNSQSVTLYSSWPTKRVQIVLKLVDNPRDVLLNFDLDPCAVGYDGSSVWMLPRFVRAMESQWLGLILT